MNKPDKVNVKNLFSAREETCFRIPDYQREYCWDEERCQALYDDLLNPDGRKEIFLGTFVTNTSKEPDGNEYLDVVDGQQRVTTFFLILRAGLQYLSEQLDGAGDSSDDVKECAEKSAGTTDGKLEKPIDIINGEVWEELKSKLKAALWMKNEIGVRDSSGLSRLIINSPFDDAKTDFAEIATTPLQKSYAIFKALEDKANRRSRYSENLFFFYSKFKRIGFKSVVAAMNTILDRFHVLHLNCDDLPEALIVFDTLNNRGIQLKDADIFKAHLYRAFEEEDDRRRFIQAWNAVLNRLREIGGSRFVIDDLFHQYVFWIGLKEGDRSIRDVKAVRSFYLDRDRAGGKYLERNKKDIIEHIGALASMWHDLEKRENFSIEALKWYHCLVKGKNDQWMWAVAAYYLKLLYGFDGQTSGCDKSLNDEQMGMFAEFLRRLTAGIYYCCLSAEGSISDNVKGFVFRVIRKMKDNSRPEDLVEVDHPMMKKDMLQTALRDVACGSRGNNPVNDKAYVFIHTYLNAGQKELLPYETDIEHIFPKSWVRQFKDRFVDGMGIGSGDDTGRQFVEYFGNKICLEKLNNIKCSDIYFSQKLNIYENGAPATEKSVGIEKSKIQDVIDFYTEQKNRSQPRWGKEDILRRDDDFTGALFDFFRDGIKFPAAQD